MEFFFLSVASLCAASAVAFASVFLIAGLNQAVISVCRVGPLLPCLLSAKQTGLYSPTETGMCRISINSERCERRALFALLCFDSMDIWAVDEIRRLLNVTHHSLVISDSLY